MPIITTTPQTGDPFGPGFFIEVTNDVVGPLAPGSFWTFTLTAPANEILIASCTVPYESNTVLTVMKSGTPVATSIRPAMPETVHGESGQLLVELTESGEGVIADLAIPIVVDRVSGQSAEMMQWIYDNINRENVGLTTDQGEQLQRVEAAVAITSGFGPLDLLPGLASAIDAVPPLRWGSLSGAYTISGDGDLPDIHATDGKYGVYWLATSIPAGLGHVHGNTEEYLQRIVQWRTTHIVGGTEMVTELLDANYHGAIWRWAQQKPERLSYSILPGVVLEARYWQFP